MVHINSLLFLSHLPESMNINSYVCTNNLIVWNPFEKDPYYMCRTTHYNYWSPKHDPDPTESLVWVLTQNLKKSLPNHTM